MVNDPIADMLTRIRNANERRRPNVAIPSSKIKIKIAEILKNEGYISDYYVKKIDNVKSDLLINLKYKQKARVITGLRRISKPGLRIYAESKNLPSVLNGYGVAIISTPKGVMTGKEATKLSVGGEVLAEIW